MILKYGTPQSLCKILATLVVLEMFLKTSPHVSGPQGCPFLNVHDCHVTHGHFHFLNYGKTLLVNKQIAILSLMFITCQMEMLGRSPFDLRPQVANLEIGCLLRVY